MHHQLDQLETPVPLVDLDILDRNLDRMAAYAGEHGLALRPHIKTHKSSRVGNEQIRRGAIGLTCATLREAEVMSDLTDDILLAYPPVGEPKLRRLMALPDHVRPLIALDSAESIDGLAAAAKERGRPIRVLVELDLGMHRVGATSAERALALAQRVVAAPPLEFAGINFYPGHIRQAVGQQGSSLEKLNADLHDVLAQFERAGLKPGIVSGGSTPTAYHTHEIEGLTEFRPGTYVYNDRSTVAIGACERADCAVTVLATVVSTSVAGQAVVDAGTKALGREPRDGEAAGFGELLDHPEVTVRAMSEEHGMLDLSKTSWEPKVGDMVRIIPNHVCIVVHLNDFVYGVRADVVETAWPVAARGRAAVAG
ncbi:MAG: alanine racemase [Gemmatimonadota bacterium]